MNLCGYVAGHKVISDRKLSVRNPFTGEVVGTVDLAGSTDADQAVLAGLAPKPALSRYQRADILDRVRLRLEKDREDFARLITSEAGLCLRETRYEFGRGIDVLR